jgi:hypothetical protein
MLYGQLVAQGVVEEKSSRIVEILLTTIRPWQLMLGKVFGIGLIGLLQLGITAVVGVGAGLALDAFTFPTQIATTAAIWAVVWFLLGYLVYALLFAALGALVSRQEDVGGVTAPALMAIILPYVLAISILPGDPDNHFMAILSQIPFFLPMIMPMRIGAGRGAALADRAVAVPHRGPRRGAGLVRRSGVPQRRPPHGQPGQAHRGALFPLTYRYGAHRRDPAATPGRTGTPSPTGRYTRTAAIGAGSDPRANAHCGPRRLAILAGGG